MITETRVGVVHDWREESVFAIRFDLVAKYNIVLRQFIAK